MYNVSVIIPTFKPDNYIFECLGSLKEQIFPREKFEILLILNGDRDPFYTLLCNYINAEFGGYNIRLFYTDAAGVSNARNIGIDQCRGRYIAFIDDDDIVSENYLCRMYAMVHENIMPLSYSRAFKNNIADTFDYFITRSYERNINKRLSILNVRSFFSTPCCKLINREIIGNKRFDTEFQTGEDALFMFLISDKIKEMRLTGKDSVYYRRIRQGSLTTGRENKYTVLKCLKRISVYTLIFFGNPFRYNFLFFISRILASLKSLVLERAGIFNGLKCGP
jgi:glycosyltransferase involved in cell wall biosynthesis